jgi:hypothetical protein
MSNGTPSASCTTIADVESLTITGSGVYWNDSPEIYVINAPGDEFAFDAGAGNIWALVSAASVLSEPGTSTVKFKVGVSDTGLLTDVTWIDALWQTIAQVSANAAAGLYNGHRYIHVKTQFNSAGSDQPTLTSFSITGIPASSSGGKYSSRSTRLWANRFIVSGSNR